MEDDEKSKSNKDLKKAENELEDFIRNKYAKVVFETYSTKNPKIKNIFSGEVKRWNDIYGLNFNKLSPCLKEGLVGLIEQYGAYRLKKF